MAFISNPTGGLSKTDAIVAVGNPADAPNSRALASGTGVSIVDNGPGGTVVISASGGSTFTWTVKTTDTNMTSNNGYVQNSGGLLTFTLPASFAVGDVFQITGYGAGGWKIAQNSGQNIYFGNVTTTTGATGYLQSNNARDTVSLVGVIANNTLILTSCIGNIIYN